MRKFLLIEHEDDGTPSRVIACDTEAERVDATRLAVFGEEDIAGHEDEFADLVEKLTETGRFDFEGDPPIAWQTVTMVPFAEFLAAHK